MFVFAVGPYTHHSSIDARGSGISIVSLDEESGNWRLVDQFTDIRNPTYVSWEPVSRRLYSVAESAQGKGEIQVFSLDDQWTITPLGRRSTGVGPGCHLLADRESGYLSVASYHDGRMTVHRISDDETLPTAACSVFSYPAKGPHPTRQTQAHAHQVLRYPGSRNLYVCDLGGDRIWLHRIPEAPEDFAPEAEAALATPPGFGPRHLVFDPESPAAYILCELVPKLLLAEIRGDGVLNLIEQYDSSLDRDSAPAAVKIHPSGKVLAASNRFDDTIAVFSIDRSDSLPVLNLVDRFTSGGKIPRDMEFASDGSRLVVAHQDSHDLQVFGFNPDTGWPTGERGLPFKTGSPVCILALV